MWEVFLGDLEGVGQEVGDRGEGDGEVKVVKFSKKGLRIFGYFLVGRLFEVVVI